MPRVLARCTARNLPVKGLDTVRLTGGQGANASPVLSDPELVEGKPKDLRGERCSAHYCAVLTPVEGRLFRRWFFDKERIVMALRLYDVSKELPRLGSEFRTKQVYRCDHCETRFNRASYLDTISGRGVHTFCPYAGKKWHELVAEKRRMLLRPHPKSYREEMEQEIQEILKHHHVKDDVVGNADWSTIF